MRAVFVPAFVAAAAGLSASASAQIHLTGVVSFGANASGGSITEPAEYDNIIGTGNLPVTINGQPRGTSFLLLDGDNEFTFTGVGGVYNALSFYLDADSGFDRPFGSAPDLAVFGSNTPNTPGAGVLVQTNGQFSGTTPYSGATSFTIGDRTVSVTGFTFTSTAGAGTFRLTVVPSPAGLAMLGLGGLVLSRRRRG